MENAPALADQVRRNCTISDARFAGSYSVCGLAMRLRDLYKWENALPPYEEHDAQQVLDWIGRKESLWEDLHQAEFTDIAIDGDSIDPFDTEAINRLIAPLGLYYGAGYAHGLKPSFFLASVETQTTVRGHTVVTLGAELARDLLTLPALIQNQSVLLRQAAVGLYVWDQMLYLNQSGRPFYNFALANCGLGEKDVQSPRRCLSHVIAAQVDTFIYHEIGELSDTCFDQGIWRDIIAALPHTPVELLVRAVKDMLADTCHEGALHRIIQARSKAALGFYGAFLDGLGKKLFPEIRAAIMDFMHDGDWNAVTERVRAVYRKAADLARSITAVFVEGMQRHDSGWVSSELERRYIVPATA
jgi:hypothetical protein